MQLRPQLLAEEKERLPRNGQDAPPPRARASVVAGTPGTGKATCARGNTASSRSKTGPQRRQSRSTTRQSIWASLSGAPSPRSPSCLCHPSASSHHDEPRTTHVPPPLGARARRPGDGLVNLSHPVPNAGPSSAWFLGETAKVRTKPGNSSTWLPGRIFAHLDGGCPARTSDASLRCRPPPGAMLGTDRSGEAGPRPAAVPTLAQAGGRPGFGTGELARGICACAAGPESRLSHGGLSTRVEQVGYGDTWLVAPGSIWSRNLEEFRVRLVQRASTLVPVATM